MSAVVALVPCPCGCGAAFPEAACVACGAAYHPDVVGPDGRCQPCWEAEAAPSETGLARSRLMRRALDAMAARYGEHRAGVRYPSAPWADSRHVAYALEHDGELSAAVEASGPRVLLRRLARLLRREVRP